MDIDMIFGLFIDPIYFMNITVCDLDLNLKFNRQKDQFHRYSMHLYQRTIFITKC